ncbi:Myosin light polypeptide 6 [Desmophyllum pertusum]|uniref:Myosin light polypeptide 6 n=1 Tax=Desmophyllum pertusum TaxID=174260 RepID=A0A9W9ZM95_9CNID|nr:Myosin light polypeptide 6 [Desmophyllum pertusum]
MGKRQMKGANRISFEEFLPIFLSFGQRKPIHRSNEGFVDGLRVFDRDGNGPDICCGAASCADRIR